MKRSSNSPKILEFWKAGLRSGLTQGEAAGLGEANETRGSEGERGRGEFKEELTFTCGLAGPRE